jgi:hypothetical protein
MGRRGQLRPRPALTLLEDPVIEDVAGETGLAVGPPHGQDRLTQLTERHR